MAELSLSIFEQDGNLLVCGRLERGDQIEENGPFPFELKVSPSERNDIRWYLESYCRMPFGGFRHRASETEKQLRRRGRQLMQGIDESWLTALGGDEINYLTIESNSHSVLSLPWELATLQDDALYERGISVRRRYRVEKVNDAMANTLRILVVVARPDDTGYFDHRTTTNTLDRIASEFPDRMQVDICIPGTIERFKSMLQQADAEAEPYGVIHFDGHGIYNPKMRRGELCFEGMGDEQGLVGSDHLAPNALRKIISSVARPSLVLIEACQSAQVVPRLMADFDPRLATEDEFKHWLIENGRNPNEEDIAFLSEIMSGKELLESADVLAREGFAAALRVEDFASIPVSRSPTGSLLESGVRSVIGMSHSIHIEASALFVDAFYRGLVNGASIARSADLGRAAMRQSPLRKTARDNVSEIELSDWFVPQVYQSAQDQELTASQVFNKIEEPVQRPTVGRGRVLHHAQRAIDQCNVLQVVGSAGIGKTHLCKELVWWLQRIQFTRDGVHFIDTEHVEGENAYQYLSRILKITPSSDTETDLRKWLESHDAVVVLDLDQIAVDEFIDTLVDLVQWWSTAKVLARLLLIKRKLIEETSIECIRLAPLGTQDSQELLRALIEQQGYRWAGSDPEDSVVSNLVRRADGHPEVLRLIAKYYAFLPASAAPDEIDAFMERCATDTPCEPDTLGIASKSLNSLPESASLWLPLLKELRCMFEVNVVGAYLKQMYGLKAEDWQQIVSAWEQWGFIERMAFDERTLYRIHPLLSYRLPSILQTQEALAYVLRSMYSSLLFPLFEAEFRLGSKVKEWLVYESSNLEQQFNLALQAGEQESALTIGCVYAKVTADKFSSKQRLEWMRRLEELADREVMGWPNAAERLNVISWCLDNNQRHDALTILRAFKLELQNIEADPGFEPYLLGQIADFFALSDCNHAAAIVGCEAIAKWMNVLQEHSDQRETAGWHLTERFNKLTRSLMSRANVARAHEVSTIQSFVAANVTGSIQISAILNFARILYLQNRPFAAALLLDDWAEDVFDDQRLAAEWMELQAILLFRARNRFAQSSSLVLQALDLYEGQHDYRGAIRCYQLLGALCDATGREPEALQWFDGALQYAWKLPDLKAIEEVLRQCRGVHAKLINALSFGGHKKQAKEQAAEYESLLSETLPRLNGLREYWTESDGDMKTQFGIGEDEDVSTVPVNFDFAGRILKLTSNEGRYAELMTRLGELLAKDGKVTVGHLILQTMIDTKVKEAEAQDTEFNLRTPGDLTAR